MMSRAMPLRKPVITECGTKRSILPSFSRPKMTMRMPVTIARAKSAGTAFSPLCTRGTLATINDMALVVCTLMNTELANRAPTGVDSMTA